MDASLPLVAPARNDPHFLDRGQYERIRGQLSFRPDPKMLVLTLALNQALFATGLYLLHQGSTPAYLVSQLVFPLVSFQAFSLLHDCGHGSGARKPWLNALVGHYLSLFCFMPYYPWKYQHALHHAWTGHLEGDPTLRLLARFRRTGKLPWVLRFGWRTWIPIAAAMQHLVFWSHPVAAYRRGTRQQFLRCLVSLTWLLGAHGALHALFPATFNLRSFGLAVVVYLMAVELVNLPHHADRPTSERKLALWEQAYSTRSCYYPRLVSELLVLNFNFHIEHHLFPTLPWYRLRLARELLRPALGAGYEEAVGIGWNLRHRSMELPDVLRK